MRHPLRGVRSKVATTAISTVKAIYGARPVPLTLLVWLRRMFSTPDGLLPAGDRLTGASLEDPRLAEVLADEELGTWALGNEILDFLGDAILERRPAAILELGSGVSTVCLARYMSMIHALTGRIFVYSIEQDPAFLEKTRSLLLRAGLDQHVKLAHRPLARFHLKGEEVTCYELSDAWLDAFLGGARPDFLLIDGPSGPSGVRYATLPMVFPWLSPGARFLLDDALRDGELEIARRWTLLPGIEVEGVLLKGQGLLVGRCRT